MKHTLTLIITLFLLLSLIACDRSSSATEEQSTDEGRGGISSIIGEPEDTRYYILNTSSKKYHRTDCSYLPNEKNSLKILRTQLSDFKGYAPCGHCDP